MKQASRKNWADDFTRSAAIGAVAIALAVLPGCVHHGPDSPSAIATAGGPTSHDPTPAPTLQPQAIGPSMALPSTVDAARRLEQIVGISHEAALANTNIQADYASFQRASNPVGNFLLGLTSPATLALVNLTSSYVDAGLTADLSRTPVLAVGIDLTQTPDQIGASGEAAFITNVVNRSSSRAPTSQELQELSALAESLKTSVDPSAAGSQSIANAVATSFLATIDGVGVVVTSH